MIYKMGLKVRAGVKGGQSQASGRVTAPINTFQNSGAMGSILGTNSATSGGSGGTRGFNRRFVYDDFN